MAAAGDNTAQRQNVASATVDAITQLVDALYTIEKLADQRSKFVSPFVDSDFTSSNLNQLTAAIIGTFFDFVRPSLHTTLLDVANGGRNQQILLQMRKG